MENINSDAGSDNTLVNVTKLTNSQKVELSKYTLSLINSARSQLGKKPWTYRSGALRFADRVANQYYTHNKSCWDSDHYVAGIYVLLKLQVLIQMQVKYMKMKQAYLFHHNMAQIFVLCQF